MHHVSLRNFFADGVFGSVRLDDRRDALEAAFGPPENVSASRDPRPPAIWKYGDLEFHLEHDALWLIYFDGFSATGSVPSGGSNIQLDPWFVSESTPLLLAAKFLEDAGLAHAIIHEPQFDRTLITLQTRVELAFRDAIEDEERSLIFVSQRRQRAAEQA